MAEETKDSPGFYTICNNDDAQEDATWHPDLDSAIKAASLDAEENVGSVYLVLQPVIKVTTPKAETVIEHLVGEGNAASL